MDPGIRVAYTLREAADLGHADRVGLQNSSWADVMASQTVDWGRLQGKQQPQVRISAECAHALTQRSEIADAPIRMLCSAQERLRHAAVADSHEPEALSQVKCCGLPDGKDSIDFSRDCRWEEVATGN
jgi:hypothetical protein